jgi:uncharacterized protein YkwD
VIELGNRARADADARPLREVDVLTTAAQEYARELAQRRLLDHASATPGRTTPAQRIEAAGGTWKRAAENLASMSDYTNVPRVTINLWLNSPPHRRNLLDPAYTTTGVGVARDASGTWYIVQLYVLPPAAR